MRFGTLMLVLLCFVLVGCGADEPPKNLLSDIDMSVADAGSGEKLFNQSSNGAPTCASCHGVEDGGGGGIGPSLVGIANEADSRVNGQESTEYLYWSIIRPARHLVVGYSNVMFTGYDEAYETADIADLIAYMQTLD